MAKKIKFVKGTEEQYKSQPSYTSDGSVFFTEKGIIYAHGIPYGVDTDTLNDLKTKAKKTYVTNVSVTGSQADNGNIVISKSDGSVEPIKINMAEHSKDGLMSGEHYNIVEALKGLQSLNLKKYNSSSVNVLEEYGLVGNNGEEVGNVRIPVYKDQAFVTAKRGHVDDVVNADNGNIQEGTGAEALVLVYKNANGKYVSVALNVSDLVKESEFKDGLNVESGQVNVKLSNDTESVKYLKLVDKGDGNKSIEFKGMEEFVSNAINTVSSTVNQDLTWVELD